MSDATPDTVSPGPVSRDQIWASAVAVAADSVEQLRRCDVERVVSLVDAADRTALTGWLIARRLCPRSRRKPTHESAVATPAARPH